MSIFLKDERMSLKLVSHACIFLRKDLREEIHKEAYIKNYARDLTNHCVHMYVIDLTKQFVCRNIKVKIAKIICKDGSFQ